MKAVIRAARGGLAGRRLQAVVIGLVVLACTAASVLALGMLVDTRSPFDHAFAAQHGADIAADVAADAGQQAATSRVAGVTATAGPFPETSVTADIKVPAEGFAGPPISVQLVGRPTPGGPVDDLTLESGHWPRSADQVVWSESAPQSGLMAVGAKVTLTGVSGSPVLTVVGIANSVTSTADAWVLPGEITTLERGGASAGKSQMLYRFASAGTGAAVQADIAKLRSALPPGALSGARSSLAIRDQERSNIAPWVPFIVAFGVIALVMSVLIVFNVVSGAVVAGTTRIGVLKSIGFTPAQVVGAYVAQVFVTALAGCVAGGVCGNLLAAPILSQNATVYQVGTLSVPLWVDLAVPLVVLALTAVAAVLPALWAGRMSAVQAIATGRAPRPSHGYFAHRLLGRLHWIPRAVTIGLATPFSRPARTSVTAAAVLFGAVAVTFGAGLGITLDRAFHEIRHDQSAPVRISALPSFRPGADRVRVFGPQAMTAAQERSITAVLTGQPSTAHYVTQTNAQLSAPGLPDQVQATAFGGDASWIGYALIKGQWYTGDRAADVNSFFLASTGLSIGDTVPLTLAGHSVTVRIAGVIFDPGNSADVYLSLGALAAAEPGAGPTSIVVGLRPGADPGAYASAVGRALFPDAAVSVASDSSEFVAVITLVALLTSLLIVVAGLGVLNTVVLQLRERVHDLGVFKSVGMTPRQTLTMVVCSVTLVGLIAGVVGVPVGVFVHHGVIPVMGHAANSDVPASLISVYAASEIVLLALAGLIIAIAGALGPASWAARTRTAFALRAE